MASRLAGERDADCSKSDKPLAIAGSEGMMVSYGRCCLPIPGDAIVGSISRGKGIVVHQDRGRTVADSLYNPERTIAVTWDEEVTGEFEASIRIEVINQAGVIAQIAAAVADAGASIEGITRQERDAHISIIQMTAGVKDRVHLARVMRRIRSQKPVLRISRGRNN